MPKPRYRAAGPIDDTSKLALAVPPSRSVSAVLKATTLSPMFEPDWISRLLVPPVQVIELAWVPLEPAGEPIPPEVVKPPLIRPELMIVRLDPTTPSPPLPPF